jgi:hypothetical protein
LLLLSLVVIPPSNGRAESVAALSALKAAYTLHFLNLIRWERRDTWLHFCAFGDSEAGDRMLGMLHNKKVNGQSVRARRLPRDGGEGERCDALYISEAHAAYAPVLLRRYENTATVTISDIQSFANDGGVIGFVVVGDRLRFDVNERVASQKRLKISAKLLELARRVIR